MWFLKQRSVYLGLIVFTIFIGLLSRSTSRMPLFMGDILWAGMVYFIVRFLLIKSSTNKTVLVSLSFSYAIEFSQLYQATWINHLRHTLFGRLVLGQTFLWGDLLSYTIGIAIAAAIDSRIRRRLAINSND